MLKSISVYVMSLWATLLYDGIWFVPWCVILCCYIMTGSQCRIDIMSSMIAGVDVSMNYDILC